MSTRGKDIMSEYELAYTELEYDYIKSTPEVPFHVTLFRKVVFIIQFCMIAGACIITAGAIIAERNSLRFSPLPFGSMEKELLYTAWACGAMSCISAIIGCIGGRYRSKILLVVYLFSVLAAFTLAIATTSQAFMDKTNVFNYAQRQWRRLTAAQERLYQTENKCCNFGSLTPCCRFAPGQGDCTNSLYCFETIEEHLLDQLTIIAATSLVQAIFLFIVLLSSLVFCRVLDRWPDLMKGMKGKNKSKEGFNYQESERYNHSIYGVAGHVDFDKKDDDYF